MAPVTTDTISSLEKYLQQYPSIKIYTPNSSGYEAVRKCFVNLPAKPLAIARPQTASDVQALVRYCVQNNVDFNIRTGGHDIAGRSQVPDVLMIDMRDINYVHVDESKTTARIGGGILAGHLLGVLGEHELIAPCGTMGSVGYVGWSTLGGYGPFSTIHGLGVDQILGAKLVNPKGEIVDAGSELLKGLRGGGGTFGAVVELTIKVYPLKELLTCSILYESSDAKAAWASYTEGYGKLVAEETLPRALQVQTFFIEIPNVGKSLIVAASWAAADHEEGSRWFDKVAGLGNCIMKQTRAMSLAQYAEENEKVMSKPYYGRIQTINIKRWTPKTAAILAKYSEQLPDPGSALSIHALRSPKPNEESVFGSRRDHFMVEVLGLAQDPNNAEKGGLWGEACVKELREQDPENVLDDIYISLANDRTSDLKKIYGSHYQELLNLKKKYDPENVFKYAVPRFAI